ncbi:hypothetical protein K9L16_01475 [Candidatus Pacearchaeota archaeon]|nr:hypothetical protein [Candidatus Pacearchaeota archaeon]
MNKKAKQKIAISEIIILLLGIFAFTYLIATSSEIGVVSADSRENSLEGQDNLEKYSTGGLAAILPVIGGGSDRSEIAEQQKTLLENTQTTQTGSEGGDGSAKTPQAEGIGKRVVEFFNADTSPNTWGFSAAGIINGAVYAGVIYGFVRLFGGLVLDDATTNALSAAAAGGYFAYSGVSSLIGEGGVLSDTFSGWAGTGGEVWGMGAQGWSTAIGAAVAVVIFVSMYKDEEIRTVSFDCNVWEAPEGGEHCEECNEQGILPCSEYQCRSLGASCELLNKGTSEEKCAWVNKNDVEFPTIQPWLDVLTDDYKYTPDNTISPPDRGVKIQYTQAPGSGEDATCVRAFTPLNFGIYTNEPAQCKLDYNRKSSFEEMEFYFGGSSLYKYNHTQTMSLPGKANLANENLTIQNNGDFSLYVRCKDSNGNYNTGNFVFKYCVEQGPDTTPPLIVATNLINNMPIAFNQTELDIIVYTNEPSDCKWSHLDRSYSEMENLMTCSRSISEINSQMLYECKTILDGIKSRNENKFYFRCKDQPRGVEEKDRNTNSESYEYTVIGTQPLAIDSVKPYKETIKDSSENVKVKFEVETSAGYKQGEASCYYSSTGDDENYIKFYETDSYEHQQELWLTEGDYEYWIKCIDLGGNADINKTIFSVDSDIEPPVTVRAFNEDNYLKIITNEKAECVYSSSSCNYAFEDGISLTSSGLNKTEHYTEWNTDKTYYIKCKDAYDNQPAQDVCNIVVRPFEL